MSAEEPKEFGISVRVSNVPFEIGHFVDKPFKTSNTEEPLSCNHLFKYLMQSMNFRAVSYDHAVYVDESLLYALQITPVYSSSIYLRTDAKKEEHDKLLANIIAFSRAKGVNSSNMELLPRKTSKMFVNDVSRSGRAAVAFSRGAPLDGVDNIVQWVLLPSGEWQCHNCDIFETRAEAYAGMKFGKLVLPTGWVKDVTTYGFPMYLWQQLRLISAEDADALYYKWLTCGSFDHFENIPYSIDPIRVTDILGLATCGVLLFIEENAPPARKYGDASLPAYVKNCSGTIPRNNHLTHLFARDESSYGVEYLYASKKAFFGDGLISFALSIFDAAYVKWRSTTGEDPFAAGCIHVGEIAAYILYAMYAGDIQTVRQVFGQLVRRAGKLKSNLRLKTSHRESVRIVSVNQDGWTALYSEGRNSMNNDQRGRSGSRHRGTSRSKSSGRSNSRPGRSHTPSGKKDQGGQHQDGGGNRQKQQQQPAYGNLPSGFAKVENMPKGPSVKGSKRQKG